jgi:large subunit ribosomal protein L18
LASKTEKRKRRHFRIRKKVKGVGERPRLCVFRSSKHIYAQIIDDDRGATLVSASTLDKELKAQNGHKGNVETAKIIGGIIGRKAADKGIRKVVFDRSGYLYHGRVKALATAARESGLEF